MLYEVITLLVILGVAALRGGRGKRPPDAVAVALFEALISAALLVLAFRSRRFAFLAALILAPVLARRLEGLLRPALLLGLSLVLRITSYNVCYTKLLRFALSQ